MLVLTPWLATACAAQSSNLVPDALTGSQNDSFEHIAKKVNNPCAEPELEAYASLNDLLAAQKTCHEAWLISETISFFIQAGYSDEDVLSVAKTEARNLAAPASFELTDRPKKGPDNAPVQIVVFSDFQCPYCARGAQTLERIAEDYPEDTQIIFKHLPLINMHPEALPAAMCAAYANTKDKFWQIHDKLFENQKELSPAYISKIVENDLGATIEDIYNETNGHDYSMTIVEDMEDAEKAHVHGTPTFFINGVLVEGGLSYKRLAHRIDAEKTAPKPASASARARHRAKILAACPYDNETLKNIYELLTTNGKERVTNIASELPCPCPNARGNLHECVNNENVCTYANELLERIMERVNEGVDNDKLLDEVQSILIKARLGE